MEAFKLDAFILHNERENLIQEVVSELEKRHVSTYFWRRDIEVGQEWAPIESEKLITARAVVVFLGSAGWGENHLGIALRAKKLEKRLIPVLIGDPPPGDVEKVGGLFKSKRYIELRRMDTYALDQLALAIRKSDVQFAATPQLDGLIRTIVDGSESERVSLLDQVATSTSLDRRALSQRLRSVLSDRFGPGVEDKFEAADRDPNKISSIRSWLLSCLLWTDAEDFENREIITLYLEPNKSSPTSGERSLRFWVLAGIFTVQASYAVELAKNLLEDQTPEVKLLAAAIVDRSRAVAEIRSALSATSFTVVWPALRTLRIVPIPELAQDLCRQLERTDVDGPVAYDALYALSSPPMAKAASTLLENDLGVTSLVRLIFEIAIDSDLNATRTFARLLNSMPAGKVNEALETGLGESRFAEIAALLRRFLREFRSSEGGETLIAGYSSDAIDVDQDELDIREDVYTLSALMISQDVKPPLAIGLFGDWGTGKSFFMKSLQKACEVLRAKPKFCQNIVSIEFNAWHYVDTNLWASMVSHILERLATQVSPAETQELKEAALTAELFSAKTIVDEATNEKTRTQEMIHSRAAELHNAQIERHQKEIALRDLRASDIRDLLDKTENAELKQSLKTALDEMGILAVLDNAADLGRLVSEAGSLRVRMTGFVKSLWQGKNRALVIWMLVFVLIVIPLAGQFLRMLVVDGFFVQISSVSAQLAAFLIWSRKIIENTLQQVSKQASNFAKAKNRIDELLERKRQEPSDEEKKLEKDIAALKAKEEQSEAKLLLAAARVLELEERIKSMQAGRSLVQFLAERTRSDDYRKHLGLVSTIRQDFEALSKRLGDPSPTDNLNRVDRIVLYIDDLDRCPEDKVMEVLQAVHLLLAYPLFVVVVAVDPRWLLHSLQEKYGAFRRNPLLEEGGHNEAWRSTPQNYLEKIFQIPFSLRQMTSSGYERLVGTLMSPSSNVGVSEQAVMIKQSQTETKGSSNTANTEQIEGQSDGGESITSLVGPDLELKQRQRATQPFRIYEEALTIQAWETKFAQKLFTLIPTPRAAKRFSNVYRILKAPIPADRLGKFEGSEEMPGEFQVPMLLLAVLVGAPAEAAAIFPKLQTTAKRDGEISEELYILSGLKMESGDKLRSLQEKIRSIVDHAQFPREPSLFAYWIPRIARFSFDVGRSVENSN